MNIERFEAELERVLVVELQARVQDFACHEMKSFDLGVHPWHGYLEPSFLTTEDTAGPRQIGDWRLYNFADTAGARWPAAQALARWMREYHAQNPREHAHLLLAAAAAVMIRPEVQAALQRFRRTPDFFVSVYDPDDASYFNHCS